MVARGIKALFLCLIAAVALTGCNASPAVLPPHPNQLSQLDGQVYDMLVAADAGIKQAKAQIAAASLPASAKATVNDVITVYNTTRAAWLAYENVVKANQSAASSGPAFTALSADYTQLKGAVTSLQTLGSTQ